MSRRGEEGQERNLPGLTTHKVVVVQVVIGAMFAKKHRQRINIVVFLEWCVRSPWKCKSDINYSLRFGLLSLLAGSPAIVS